MNIIIIEDELLTAQDLDEMILAYLPNATILKRIVSIKTALDFFTKNTQKIDLIFSDIQLQDGLCFEIYAKIKITCPIIFCTAYDEFALEAFKVNGIDYLLKPFSQKTIETSLSKFLSLTGKKDQNYEIESYANRILQTIQSFSNLQHKAILVSYKDTFIPISANEIVLIYVQNSLTHILASDKKIYSVPQTLEELELKFGLQFFRANRQFLVNKNHIKDIAHSFARKMTIRLTVDFPEPIIVSKLRVSALMEWMER